MAFRDAQNQRRQKAAKRAFEVIELARLLKLSAESAEALYDRAGGDLVRCVVIAKEEGLVPASVEVPPISAIGRK